MLGKLLCLLSLHAWHHAFTGKGDGRYCQRKACRRFEEADGEASKWQGGN